MLAFTFPGQGSQRPGMGAAWVDHPSWELVEHASAIVDRDVAALLLDADQTTLTLTSNAQLATFVLSLVVLDAAERLGVVPAAAAGHSLGEYTALVATGAVDFDDGLRLVAERGAAMQDAADQASGTMMAVLGLADDDVEAACLRAEGDVWVANFNAPGQVVIAGSPDALAVAATIARSLGAKRVLPIPVGGAFHTPYMAPARERLRKALAAATFREPEPGVVANVDARLHLDPAEWPSLLSAQLCGPVRWRQSLETLHAAGARTFVELGPGGVLTGLVKRVLGNDARARSVATPEELERLVEMLAPPPSSSLSTAPAHAGERYAMTERLVVAPSTGPFAPAPDCLPAVPTLASASGRARRSRARGASAAPAPEPDVASRAPIHIRVGDLVGWAGAAEIRSAFAGTLEGVLVLPGERVVAGQPVAWLRADVEVGAREQPSA
ncbi:MAG TPA: ACP S-malonyltransferase [Acidimicrobiales bacterium]|nr:ACP S-malonyltransferase [Acidimicrobiales bacterium]